MAADEAVVFQDIDGDGEALGPRVHRRAHTPLARFRDHNPVLGRMAFHSACESRL